MRVVPRHSFRAATGAVPVLSAGLVLLGACASVPTFHGSAVALGGTLVAQLERRVDLRNQRVYVADLQPCHRTESGDVVPMDPAMALRHRLSAQRFKHELMGVLASEVRVLESESLPMPPGAQQGPGAVYEQAQALGATAVLLGNYVMEGDHVLVMLRVVDAAEKTVLATSEGLVPHATLPAQADGHEPEHGPSRNGRTLNGV